MKRKIHQLDPTRGYSAPISGHHSYGICGATCQDNFDYCMTEDSSRVTCKVCCRIAREAMAKAGGR